MTPLVVDPSGYLKPHHSVGHCLAPGYNCAPNCSISDPRNRNRRGLRSESVMRQSQSSVGSAREAATLR